MLAHKVLLVCILVTIAAASWGINGFANAPVLDDLKLNQALDDPIVSSGASWVVHLSLDVSHQPLAAVSNLTLRAYDQLGGQVAEYVDHPFHPHGGSSVNDYSVSIEIPKFASGYLVIEACAKHGNDWGCTTWEGWIPQESSYEFSRGGLEFLHGTQLKDAGLFESTQRILTIRACAPLTVSLETLDCRLICSDLNAEIPSWWRVWDNSGNNDGKLDLGELVDSGWIAAADFVAHWNESRIVAPSGWSGEIRFQLKMERSGLGDPSGHYSTVLDVTASEEP